VTLAPLACRAAWTNASDLVHVPRAHGGVCDHRVQLHEIGTVDELVPSRHDERIRVGAGSRGRQQPPAMIQVPAARTCGSPRGPPAVADNRVQRPLPPVDGVGSPHGADVARPATPAPVSIRHCFRKSSSRSSGTPARSIPWAPPGIVRVAVGDHQPALSSIRTHPRPRGCPDRRSGPPSTDGRSTRCGRPRPGRDADRSRSLRPSARPPSRYSRRSGMRPSRATRRPFPARPLPRLRLFALDGQHVTIVGCLKSASKKARASGSSRGHPRGPGGNRHLAWCRVQLESTSNLSRRPTTTGRLSVLCGEREQEHVPVGANGSPVAVAANGDETAGRLPDPGPRDLRRDPEPRAVRPSARSSCGSACPSVLAGPSVTYENLHDKTKRDLRNRKQRSDTRGLRACS